MYSHIKRSIKTIIPKKFLFNNELLFRNVFGLFYKGSTHHCNICAKDLRTFIFLKNKDLLCPFCGSLSRNRRLWKILNDNKALHGNLLHFSPSRSLFRKLKKTKSINYFSSDFENEFIADYHFDITAIDQESNKFDTIICYHILEHVVDDKKAMGELYRVLKPNGSIYIQTPFKNGDIYEDYSIKSPEERTKHFGQHDHIRIYSVIGLKSRLENTGFRVIIKTFEKEQIDFKNGFVSPETVLIATK
ncbi:methyltransferase domain-containing protein [Tamlana flava]|uniref:methyltransferase domain-containing protein n=1 Tax=Tamlana flava TaxID=3158572 RepID=UPI00351B2F76